MSDKQKKPDRKTQEWNEAAKRHRLSPAQVRMARELGLNPKKIGGMDNHRQEPWKMPLKEFIKYLYDKRFGKKRAVADLKIYRKKEKDHAKGLGV